MFSVCVFLKSTNGSALGYLWQIKVSSPWLCTIFLPMFLWHCCHFHFIYELEVASLTLTKPQGQRCRNCTVFLTITSIAMHQYLLHVKIWEFLMFCDLIHDWCILCYSGFFPCPLPRSVGLFLLKCLLEWRCLIFFVVLMKLSGSSLC